MNAAANAGGGSGSSPNGSGSGGADEVASFPVIVGAPEAVTAADAARKVAEATADVNATFEEIARDDEGDETAAAARIFGNAAADADADADADDDDDDAGGDDDGAGAGGRVGAGGEILLPPTAGSFDTSPVVVKPVPKHLLDMLDEALADADPLEEQISGLSDKLGEQHPSVIKARKQMVLFRKVHGGAVQVEQLVVDPRRERYAYYGFKKV